MKTLIKFFVVVTLATNSFGQEPTHAPTEVMYSEVTFLLIERIIGEKYFQALTHTTHDPGYHTNWVDSGRASEQRTELIKSIETLIETLEKAQDWFYDGNGKRILNRESQALDVHLQQELGRVRLAYQVLPDEWLTQVIIGKVSENGPEKSNFQKTTFFRLFNAGFSRASFYDLLPELKNLLKLYKSGHPLSDIFVNEQKITPVVVKAQLDAQLLLIKTLAEVAENSDLTVEQFTKLIRDLGRGEGAFKSLVEKMKLKLDYSASNGVNYFSLFRDQHRKVCNAIILEFDLQLHSFMMTTPERFSSGKSEHYRLAEMDLYSRFNGDPVASGIRQQLAQVVGRMKR